MESHRARPRRPDRSRSSRRLSASTTRRTAMRYPTPHPASTTSAPMPRACRRWRCAPTSPASSASPSAGRWTRRCRSSRGGSSGRTSATSSAAATSPTPSRAFFENGGRRCWVVRVAHRDFDGEGRPSTARGRPVDLADVDGDAGAAHRAPSAGQLGQRARRCEWSRFRPVVTTSRARHEHAATTRVLVGRGLRRRRAGAHRAARRAAAVPRDRRGRRRMSRALHWVHPDRRGRGPATRALRRSTRSLPLRIVRIAYALAVRERGIVVAQLPRPAPGAATTRASSATCCARRLLGSLLQASALVAEQAGRCGARRRALGDAAAAARPLHRRAPVDRRHSPPARRAASTARSRSAAAGRPDRLAADDFIGEPVSRRGQRLRPRAQARGLRAARRSTRSRCVAVPDILIQPAPAAGHLPLPGAAADPACPARRPSRRAPSTQPAPPASCRRASPTTTSRRVQAALDRAVRGAPATASRCSALPLRLATIRDVAARRLDRLARALRLALRRALRALAARGRPLPRGDVRHAHSCPPCGHVPGTIAATDLAVGVQRAPGERQRRRRGATSCARSTTSCTALLNEVGVNVLRAESGEAPLVGGARTLSHDPQWRYVNVRRLMLMIKKAVDIALRWTVFEPNDERCARTGARHADRDPASASHDAAPSPATARRSRSSCAATRRPTRRRRATRPAGRRGRLRAGRPSEFIVLRVGRAGRGRRQVDAVRGGGEFAHEPGSARSTRCSPTTSSCQPDSTRPPAPAAADLDRAVAAGRRPAGRLHRVQRPGDDARAWRTTTKAATTARC